MFVGISFIDLTLAFWEELKEYVKNYGGEDMEDQEGVENGRG